MKTNANDLKFVDDIEYSKFYLRLASKIIKLNYKV